MQTQNLEYQDGKILLEGFLAYEGEADKKRPAILVVHDWSGRNEFACNKARALTKLGYAAFAVDMYGKGVIGNTNEEKSRLIQPLKEDRNLLKNRIMAAYDVVKTLAMVDTKRLGVIGFCFGGLCALDLARTGVPLSGAVSFHGLLMPPSNQKSSTIIKSKILVLHGFDDPMVPPEQVLAFQQEMTAAQADWQMHIYGHTMHAFTNPNADDSAFGTVYNAVADSRSWIAMRDFFQEVL